MMYEPGSCALPAVPAARSKTRSHAATLADLRHRRGPDDRDLRSRRGALAPVRHDRHRYAYGPLAIAPLQLECLPASYTFDGL